MSKYKNHHYVPQFLLKNFRNSHKKLFYFNRNTPHKRIEHRNSEKIFRKNHLYSYENDDGTTNTSIEEHYFKQLDTNANDIINKIIDQVRQDKKPQLSDTERNIWDEFFMKFVSRSPEWLNSHSTNEMLENTFQKTKKELYNYCSTDNKKLLDDPNFKARVQKKSKVQALRTPPQESKEILAKRGLLFVHLRNSKKSFIIGSSPLVRYSNHGTNKLSDPRTELWLPVSHDIAVSIGSTDQKELLLHFEGPKSETKILRKTNNSIFEQSDEIAGRSKELIASLTYNFRKNCT